MRHGLSGRQLNRDAPHRHALFNNLVTALFTYGRIETTEAKAKELRKFAESTIKLGVNVADLVSKGEKMTPAERSKVVHARRMARQTLKTGAAVDRLFTEIGPHFKTRPGGYTRVIKTRFRRGDAASMALIELIGLAPSVTG
jgi:large subunit ribosomal protein L17